MNPKYRFFLRIGSSTYQNAINPIWKDSLSLVYARESGQWFHRAELSSTVDMIGTDYDLVISQTFGTTFYMDIEISDNGASWTAYWTGRFTITDCKVDVDHKKITVKPKVVDDYTDVLDGMEKEFDLIKLNPVIQPIQVIKRPAIQVFDMASETLTVLVGNISFEQDVSLPSDNVRAFLINHCHFQLLRSDVEVVFTETDFFSRQYFVDPFTGTINQTGDQLTNDTNVYFIQYIQNSAGWANGLEICSRAQPTDVKWHFYQQGSEGFLPLPTEIEFESNYPLSYSNMKARCLDHSLLSRVVCNVRSVDGVETYEIPSDDITSNRNYRRTFPYDASSMIYTSQRTTTTPNSYGINDDGEYYLPPDSNYEYIPVSRNTWGIHSIWIRKTNDYKQIEKVASYMYTLKDAYPLWSCINQVLNEITGGTVEFRGDEYYSQFLYATGNSDPITGRDCRLYITPKSNMTAGEYQTPAQQAPVTLKMLLDMLKNTYQCYWYLQRVGNVVGMHIEHVRFFENGGSYWLDPTQGIDLTTMQNVRNGKNWSYNTNVYEFEKSDMPERYQFSWMDDVSEPFKGQPIDVLSPYVSKGMVEEITVSNFTSDIDLMLLNPSAFSPDGFAVMGVTAANALGFEDYSSYFNGIDGKIFPVAGFVQGKRCYLDLTASSGSGTITLVFVYNGNRVRSSYTWSVTFSRTTKTIDIPANVTGISFEASDNAFVIVYGLTVPAMASPEQDEVLQVPVLTLTRGLQSYRMQNGYLSFHMLQLPYWQYNMPARSLRIDGDVTQAMSIKKNKKQTVSIPLGLTDPDPIALIKTGLGNGMVQQMSIRLTSRIAKTELRYDTE